jgi:hypothetical protein
MADLSNIIIGAFFHLFTTSIKSRNRRKSLGNLIKCIKFCFAYFSQIVEAKMQFLRTGFGESDNEHDDVSLRKRGSVSFGNTVMAYDAPVHSSPSSSSNSRSSTPEKDARLSSTAIRSEEEDDKEILLREEASAQAAKSDPRLQEALRLVKKLSSAKLKEQCLVTEWSAARTDIEKEILLEAVADPGFWREVKEMALADVDAVPDEEDDVDTESRLYQMFKCFDRDGGGTIGANELHQMLLYMGISVSEDEVETMIRQVDSDCDGRLVQAEFMLIMKRAQAGQLSIAAPTRQTIRRASFRVTQNRPVFNVSE